MDRRIPCPTATPGPARSCRKAPRWHSPKVQRLFLVFGTVLHVSSPCGHACGGGSSLGAVVTRKLAWPPRARARPCVTLRPGLSTSPTPPSNTMTRTGLKVSPHHVRGLCSSMDSVSVVNLLPLWCKYFGGIQLRAHNPIRRPSTQCHIWPVSLATQERDSTPLGEKMWHTNLVATATDRSMNFSGRLTSNLLLLVARASTR